MPRRPVASRWRGRRRDSTSISIAPMIPRPRRANEPTTCTSRPARCRRPRRPSRARSADLACQRAGEQIAALFDGHDLALRATIEMERDMKDALRAEARDRQTELYDALHQLEGKYAHIQKTARGTILSLADILFDFDKATLKRRCRVQPRQGRDDPEPVRRDEDRRRGTHGQHRHGRVQPRSSRSARAQAVHDFLVSQDVSPERMTVAGYGLTRPVADNATEEGRQKNRRVDLVIQERP